MKAKFSPLIQKELNKLQRVDKKLFKRIEKQIALFSRKLKQYVEYFYYHELNPGAQGETRTPTPLRAQRSEHCVYTSFTTWAK